MKHVNIPVFIPHLGCPNNCVFCNQRKISGVDEFSPDNVRGIIEDALSTIPDDAEVATSSSTPTTSGPTYTPTWACC